MSGISLLLKDSPESSLGPLAMRGHREDGHLWIRKGFSPDLESAGLGPAITTRIINF